MCPAHFIRLLTILPTIHDLVKTSCLWSYILLLSTLFTPALVLIQLFSHTCSLFCCSSDRTNVAKPLYVLAGTTQESRTFPISFLEICQSILTLSTLVDAFDTVCIPRRTSISTRPLSGTSCRTHNVISVVGHIFKFISNTYFSCRTFISIIIIVGYIFQLSDTDFNYKAHISIVGHIF